jgi:hypothetical protein
VTLAVSSFAADEQFAPRTIHLAFGDHVITAKAPGYETVQQSISIADKTPKQVAITLRPLPPTHVTGESRTPWYVVGAGGAVLALGAAYHLVALNPLRERLAADVGNPETLDIADYKAHSHEFDVRRDVTIALYGVGAATVLTGLVLRTTVMRGRDVEIMAAPRAGGGVITLTWGLP